MSASTDTCEVIEKEERHHGLNKADNFTRRISRADLDSPPLVSAASSLERDEKLARKLDVFYRSFYEYGNPVLKLGEKEPRVACGINISNKERKLESESENFYEFRLFSSLDASTQIVILDREPFISQSENKKGGFIIPNRCSDYYFAQQAKELRKIQYARVAIDGDTVIKWSRQRAWALEVPWRVKVVKNGEFSRRIKVQGLQENGPKKSVSSYSSIRLKRSKPGKKRRIRMREKSRAALAIKEQLRCAEELRLQVEKEKRVRRNREKKIKRKLKMIKSRATVNAN